MSGGSSEGQCVEEGRQDERRAGLCLLMSKRWVFRYGFLCVQPEKDRVVFRSSRGQKTTKLIY